MMIEEDMTAVDQALADIEWIRTAPALYAKTTRELDQLTKTEPVLAGDSIEHLVARGALQRQVDALRPVVKDPRPFLEAALMQLRMANGVETVRVVTPELGALAMRRLAQGYSLNQAALMIGCTASTVSAIKAGRYRYSELPPDAKIGSRGHLKTR